MRKSVYSQKISDLPELLEKIKNLRQEAKSIVFTNGCFDILHPGHVDLLARSKELGDILILALNSDESVKRLNKGAGRPINKFEARAFVLAHLASVDFLLSFSEDTPYELIRAIKPDVLVKGGDWKSEDIVGGDIVKSFGGKVYSLPLIEGFSTTALINKIRKNVEDKV